MKQTVQDRSADLGSAEVQKNVQELILTVYFWIGDSVSYKLRPERSISLSKITFLE